MLSDTDLSIEIKWTFGAGKVAQRKTAKGKRPFVEAGKVKKHERERERNKGQRKAAKTRTEKKHG